MASFFCLIEKLYWYLFELTMIEKQTIDFGIPILEFPPDSDSTFDWSYIKLQFFDFIELMLRKKQTFSIKLPSAFEFIIDETFRTKLNHMARLFSKVWFVFIWFNNKREKTIYLEFPPDCDSTFDWELVTASIFDFV